MAPYVELFESAVEKPIRAVVASPPQHGKTECTLHGLVWALRKVPGRRHAYATYQQQRSERQSDKARRIAQRDHIELDWRKEFWLDTDTEGSILWTSRQGPFSGEPVDGVLVVDDITKDRKEAESSTIRSQIVDWFDDVAEPRCHPSASIIVLATRWHKDDLPGQLLARGWRYINLKAIAEPRDSRDIDDAGRVISDPLKRLPNEPLCPARKSLEALEQKRRENAYGFASLYQGEPRPRDGAVFGEPTYYDKLPENGYRVGYGVDLAYSAKKKSDWSVVVRMLATSETAPDGKTVKRFYVADVVRHQVDAPSFLLTLKARHSEQRGPMLWIASGTEKGTAQFIQQRVPLQVKTASEDKYQRALPVSAAWNSGLVMVPSLAEDDPRREWLDAFLDEIQNFTGVADAHDDQVDALAAAHALLSGPRYEGGGLSGDVAAVF